VDIWAVGVIAYELLYGKVPFNGDNDEALKTSILHDKVTFPKDVKVSDKAKDFINNCLEKDPEERFEASELLNEDPWIASVKKEEVKPEEIVNAFKNVLTYSKSTRFEKSILLMLLGIIPKDDDYDRIKRIFKLIDEDHNGSISV